MSPYTSSPSPNPHHTYNINTNTHTHTHTMNIHADIYNINTPIHILSKNAETHWLCNTNTPKPHPQLPTHSHSPTHPHDKHTGSLTQTPSNHPHSHSLTHIHPPTHTDSWMYTHGNESTFQISLKKLVEGIHHAFRELLS